MKCNGAKHLVSPEEAADLRRDERLENGIQEKILRLSQEGIEAVHLGLCTNEKDIM